MMYSHSCTLLTKAINDENVSKEKVNKLIGILRMFTFNVPYLVITIA